MTYPRAATVRFPRCCRVARAETRHLAVWRNPMRAHMSGIARIRPRVSRVPVVVPTGCPVGSRRTRPIPPTLVPSLVVALTPVSPRAFIPHKISDKSR